MSSDRRRVRAGVVAATAGLLLVGCTPDPAPAPPAPPPTTEPASPTPTTLRTVTAANLVTADEVPRLPLGGTVKAYAKNARPVAKVSVCQGDLGALAATSTVHASYRQQAPDQPRTPLVDRPNVYVLALQLATPVAAEQARQTWKSWLDTCRFDIPARTGFEAVERGFGWQQLPAPPGTTEVAEIAYRPRGTTSDSNYWESTGLTVVEDRLAVTVHLYYTDESLYILDPNNDEGGFRHPQLGMTQAAAKRLSR